ncbi:hypothetical protein [Pontibacterium sp.]|uniref:hypothetical protein n=1 Tax=Pontibacterium sp. TaxID=2036026 RepID=UPI003564A569
MAGLLEAQPQQAQPVQQPQQQPAAAPITQDLSPEQIATLKKGFQIGQQILYDKQVFASMMEEIQGDPIQGLASAVVQVLQKIQEALGAMDFTITASLGIALLGDVADLVTQTGRAQYGPDEQAQALELAVQMWLGANAGQYDQNELMGAMQQMGGA